MEKRGQAAMEFLMTYGWAILAVLISIAALAYFGVLNPSRFLPQSCTLFPGIACTDVTVNNAGITLVVQNGLGQSLNPFTVNIPGCNIAPASNGLSDGEKETIVLSCNPPLVSNSRFSKDVSIAYTPVNGISHTRTGKITSAAEEGYSINGGFDFNGSTYWQLELGSATATGTIDQSLGNFISGSSYKLTVTLPGDSYHPNIRQFFTFPLEQGTYEISFWAKAAASSATNLGLVFSTFVYAHCDYSTSIPVSTIWTKITRTCTLNPLYLGNPPTDPIGFYITYNSAGTLWIDDVKFVKL